jgi:hypothetical protein
VHAIEVADRQHRAPRRGGNVVVLLKDLHTNRKAQARRRTRRRAPPRAVTTARFHPTPDRRLNDSGAAGAA